LHIFFIFVSEIQDGHHHRTYFKTGPNQILEFILIYFKIKNEKFTAPNKVLMVLGQRTGAHLEN
jgi:hypothetical protein